MPELYKANRQCCDVDIRNLATKAPFMFFDVANTTTASVEGNSVYAMGKGARKVAFQDPVSGTMTIEAQCRTFKFFALFSDGVIDTSATIFVKKNIKATEAGKITLTPGDGNTVVAGSVFVYPVDAYGVEASAIAGSFASNVFTATTAADIAADTEYAVAYLLVKAGVKKVSVNNKRLPPDLFIQMSTLDKDEDGVYTPFKMTAYKASVQRNFELTFSSEGDPMSITMTFDLLEDKDGNFLDLIEDTED